MRQFINIIEEAEKNRATYKGKPFWSGAVDTRDGHIIEVHRYEKALNADFHHNFYFSRKAIEMMLDGEAAFFWVDDRGIQSQWRNAALPAHIITAIKKQIELL